jgi:hypothetical protein
MAAEKDLPHPAAADPFENPVFANLEPSPFSLQQLIGLELGEQPIADQQLRYRSCISILEANSQACQMIPNGALVSHSALLEQTHKFRN